MYNSYEAHKAKNAMVGLSDYNLESCVGVPDQRAQVGNAEILTYYDTTTNNGVNLTLPIVGGGVSLTGSGYCHATFTLIDGRVTRVQYTGDNSQFLAPHSICAPIVDARGITRGRHLTLGPAFRDCGAEVARIGSIQIGGRYRTAVADFSARA
jgi:hypothetical protein